MEMLQVLVACIDSSGMCMGCSSSVVQHGGNVCAKFFLACLVSLSSVTKVRRRSVLAQTVCWPKWCQSNFLAESSFSVESRRENEKSPSSNPGYFTCVEISFLVGLSSLF